MLQQQGYELEKAKQHNLSYILRGVNSEALFKDRVVTEAIKFR